MTTGFIDFFAWIGWAYDLKTVSVTMINRRAARTGDGSREPVPTENDELTENDNQTQNHHHHGHSHDNCVWGWDDKDMPEEDKKDVQIYNKSD